MLKSLSVSSNAQHYRKEECNALCSYFVVVSLDISNSNRLKKFGGAEAAAYLSNTNAGENSSEEGRTYSVEKIRFRAAVSDRFPTTDRENLPLPKGIDLFCLPFGLTLSRTAKLPTYFTFASTLSSGDRLYGHCFTVYEPVDEKQRLAIQMEASSQDERSRLASIPLFVPKCLCILSPILYANEFHRILRTMYGFSMSSSDSVLPLEHYVYSLHSLPVPPPGRTSLQYTIGRQNIVFTRPPANKPFSHTILPFHIVFKCLSVENIVLIWKLLLMETKIVLHSSQLSLLTVAIEVLESLLYPFRWPHVYIPVLPLGLLGVMHAPMPFLIGCHSSVLHIAEIPHDAVIVSLDSNEIDLQIHKGAVPKLPLDYDTRLNSSVSKLAPLFRNRKKDWTERVLMRYDSTVHALLNADKDVKNSNMNWKLVRKCFFNFFVDIFKDYRDTADAVRHQQKSKKARESFKNALSAVTTDSPRNSSSSSFPIRKFSVDRQRMLDKMLSRLNRNAGQTFLSIFVKTQAVQTLVTAHFHISDAPAELLLTISFFNESIDARFHNMWYLRTFTPFLDTEYFRHTLTVHVAPPTTKKSTFISSSSSSEDRFPSLRDEVFEEAVRFADDSKQIMRDVETSKKLVMEWLQKREQLITRKRALSAFTVRKVSSSRSFNESIFATWFLVLACSACTSQNKEKLWFDLTQIGLSRMDEEGVVCDREILACALAIASVVKERNGAIAILDRAEALKIHVDEDLYDKLTSAFYEAQKADVVRGLDPWPSCVQEWESLRTTVRSSVANKAAVARIVSSATKPRRSGSLLKFLGIAGESRLGYLGDEENEDSQRNVVKKRDEEEEEEAGVTSSERSGVGSPFRSPTRGPRFARTNNESTRVMSTTSPALVKSLTSKIRDKVLKTKMKKTFVRRDISNAWRTTTLQENQDILGNLDMLQRVLPGIGFKVGHLCTLCRKPVSESQIRQGWSQNNLTEFCIGGSHETTCPHSTNKRVHTFVPALMVASSSSTWEGTHGPATPFMCKYLSPWAMYAQIHALVFRRKAFSVSFDSRFRKQHAELFWNLCMYTFEARLPFGFLLIHDDQNNKTETEIKTLLAKAPSVPPPNVDGLEWRGFFREFQNEDTENVRPIERWQASVARLRLFECLDPDLDEYSVNALLRPEAHLRLDVAITLCVILIRTVQNHLLDANIIETSRSLRSLLQLCRQARHEDCDVLESSIENVSKMGVSRVTNGVGSRVLACARWHLKQLKAWKKEYEQTKARILVFYVRFEAQSLEDPDFLDKKLKDYEGRERVLLQELLKKYGSQMVASRPPPPVPSNIVASIDNDTNMGKSRTESENDIESKNPEEKDDSTTTASLNTVKDFWSNAKSNNNESEDIRRASLLYRMKDMMSYKEGFNDEFAETDEVVTPHESAEHLNGRYVLSRDVLIKNKFPIREVSKSSSSSDLLPEGWGVHFDGVFEHQFFHHSLSDYSTWKRPQSGMLISNIMEDSAAELMEIVRSVCDRDSRAWLGLSEDREKKMKRRIHVWKIRVPDLGPRMNVVRVSLPENSKTGQLVRIEHNGLKYDVPVPTDVKRMQSGSSKTFPVAFPIQESRARRLANSFDDVLQFQFDGRIEEDMGDLVERELKEHNDMLLSTSGRVRVVVDRLLSLFWL